MMTEIVPVIQRVKLKEKDNMKYIIKVQKELPLKEGERYPTTNEVYTQTVEISDSPTIFQTSDTSGIATIVPIRSEEDFLKDVIKAVNKLN